jgi:putative acetyltransferase
MKGCAMKTLETGRLVLRNLHEVDAEDMFEYARNPRIGPPAGWKPHESIDESREILSMLQKSGEVWAIVDKASSKMIGTYGLHADKLRANPKARMIGYVLSEFFWGKGLIVEATRRVLRYAFVEEGMEIISVIHFPHNLQSRRVVEKCGFHYEGILRRTSQIFNGTICDEVCYSLTREEWGAISSRW